MRCHTSSGWGGSGDDSPHYTRHDDHKDAEPAIQKNLEEIRKGDFNSVSHLRNVNHFKQTSASTADDAERETQEPIIGTNSMPHPIWTQDEVQGVEITHKKPKDFTDRFAYFGVRMTRFVFDTVSGYNLRPVRDTRVWVNRLCFLETVAGVPGMVAAMVRHLKSLRTMNRDHGWIHTLLEEAENERMHLMVCLELKQPTLLFKLAVMLTQGIFVSGFSVAYMISPRLCHRFVGYLEEEAVITYTKLLKDIDSGSMQHWQSKPASQVAINYWNLAPDAKMKDVILAIRADEAHHRVVNHTLSSLKQDQYNPYPPGQWMSALV